MLLEQTAKVHSAENNIKTLTLKARGTKTWQAEKMRMQNLCNRPKCDSATHASRCGGEGSASTLVTRMSDAKKCVSAMRRELSRTRDHANEMLGRLHTEVASGIESVVQRAKSQQAAVQQHVEEHWIDKLQQSQRQLENARVEWATERASARQNLTRQNVVLDLHAN